MSDIDAVVVDGLKVLDPDRPIREADIAGCPFSANFGHGITICDPPIK